MDEAKQTGRLEAFSDGVFAIAITLLVLDIRVPRELSAGQLLPALLEQWPNYLAFFTSFATIGIMWVNHHRMFTYITRSNHSLLILNGLLLLGITFVPFPTALVAEYVSHADQRVAAAVYIGTFVVLSVLFNLLWRYAAQRSALLHPQADREGVDKLTRQYRFGPLFYVAAFVLIWVNVHLALFLTLLIAVFFALPDADRLRGPRRREA